MTTDLIQLYTDFWNFRRMMEPHWTTPDTRDAARFAVTEAAEVLKTCGLWEAFVAFAASRHAQIIAADALDAVLRKNASYSRNTERNMDERNELGDLAMMLLTAMGEQPPTPEKITKAANVYKLFFDKDHSIDSIVQIVGSVHVAAFLTCDREDVRHFALLCLMQIDRYPGMDLRFMLTARMNRIYRKHHPDAQAAPAANAGTLHYTDRNEGIVLGKATPATYTLTVEDGLL